MIKIAKYILLPLFIFLNILYVIQEKVDGELKGKTEKSSTDKKRERRKKKIEKRIKRKEKEKRQKLLEKMKPAFGNKKVKENAMKQMEKQSKTRRGDVTVIKVNISCRNFV